MDKRVQRTKKMLKNAMLKLLNEKKFTKITVLELVKRADVNRSTFYFHYYSKDELMEETIDDLMNGINQKLYSPFESKNKSPNFKKLYTKSIDVFQYIYENKWALATLLKSHHRFIVKDRIYEAFYTFGKASDVYQYKSNKLQDTNLYVHFRMASIVGMVLYWIEEDLQLTPEEFTQEYDKFLSTPASEYIDVL